MGTESNGETQFLFQHIGNKGIQAGRAHERVSSNSLNTEDDAIFHVHLRNDDPLFCSCHELCHLSILTALVCWEQVQL